MTSWIVIPSREGTKSKGMWKLGGHPLIEWALKKTAGGPYEVVVTTDQPEAIDLATKYGVSAVNRPRHLRAGRPGMLEESICHALLESGATENGCLDKVHIVQPTSPFFKMEDIERLDDRLRWSYTSAQTVCEIPHNYHEVNQRISNGPAIEFAHPRKRMEQRNKQSKELRYSFGNIVSARTDSLFLNRWLFGSPSYGLPVSRYEAWDVDTLDDLALAECILNAKLVPNPFTEDWENEPEFTR